MIKVSIENGDEEKDFLSGTPENCVFSGPRCNRVFRHLEKIDESAKFVILRAYADNFHRENAKKLFLLTIIFSSSNDIIRKVALTFCNNDEIIVVTIIINEKFHYFMIVRNTFL